MNATNSLTIDKVKTLDDFFIHADVVLAIRKAISKVIANVRFNRDEVRSELTAEVAAKLVKALGQTPRRKIRNKKFLKSPNRLGWVSLFAQKTSRGWIADRFKQSVGDKRIQTALVQGYIPAETLEGCLARARAEEANLAFDLYQFAGDKRRPRMVDDSDVFARAYERTENADESEDVHVESDEDVFEPAVKYDTLREERTKVMNTAIARLPKRDQKFVNTYFARDRRGPRSPAERKRFSRLTMKLRDLCHVFPEGRHTHVGPSEKAAAAQPTDAGASSC